MSRTTNKLTATGIAGLRNRGRHGDGGGLWLNVSASGSRSWVFRWTPKGGKPREMGIGPYPAVSLSKARERASVCRAQVAEGKDPKLERDKETGKTFGECADSYLAAMNDRWTNDKTRWQWNDSLTKRSMAIRNRPVSQIDTADILKVLNPIWTEIPETARRVRARIEAVLDFAKAQGWREGENPARWRGHLANVLRPMPKLVKGHVPAMAYSDVPAFMERLRDVEALAGRALEFTILTAMRTKEVLQAPWSEFDLENAIWVVPAERMKTKKREHRVPLTKETLVVLKPLLDSRINDWVFPGQKPNKPLSLMSMEMLLRRMKITDATVHGFRSSFRDWAGDCTDHPHEIIETAIAHKVGSEVEQAYRRSDALEKRRRLMEAWGEYCYGST